MSGIDTLIAENNSTFREIVGGYIIKAAIENAVKIAGNYYIGITDGRLKALKQGLVDKGFKIKTKSESPTDSIDFTYDGTSGGDMTL